MKGVAGIFEQMSLRFDEIAKISRGNGTIIVHPQVSKTAEEAKELANDWGLRESKQLRDNLSAAMRSRR